MASLTGTFSAVGNISYDLAVAPGETANIILTRTGSSDFSVAVDKRFNGSTYALVTTYAADQTAARINNDSNSILYLRLRCAGVLNGDTIAYTLEDLAGESIGGIFPIVNESGTTVFDVTDEGIESPKATITDVTATTATVTTGAITTLTGTTATYTAVNGTRVNTGAAAGAALSDSAFTKTVTAIADNVATTVLTVTIPNTTQSGVLRVTALGILGAGGAIGAGEGVASNSYDITFVRRAGVNACSVAGAATCTAALTVGSVGGAVGAVNTFAIQMTVVKSGGSSDNHVAVLTASLLNSNATGITVA